MTCARVACDLEDLAAHGGNPTIPIVTRVLFLSAVATMCLLPATSLCQLVPVADPMGEMIDDFMPVRVELGLHTHPLVFRSIELGQGDLLVLSSVFELGVEGASSHVASAHPTADEETGCQTAGDCCNDDV